MIEIVKNDNELNKTALLDFLFRKDLIDKNNGNIEIFQFTNGYSNLTYLINIDGEEFVLRRPPLGAIKRGHDMKREFKVLSGISGSFHKAPKAYLFCEDNSLIGSEFYIMEKVEGIILTLNEAKNRKIENSDFIKISDVWLDTFVELHQLDYESCGLEELGKPHGFVERQVTNWSQQYIKAEINEIMEARLVMNWLEQNQPRSYQHSLIHNDYKYDNVIFKDDTWNDIIAVLDWEMCTLGDPLIDLGTSLAYCTMESDGPLVINGLPSPTMLVGNPCRTEIVESYAKKSGNSVDNILFYYVFGLFKIAVIAQQIYFRYHKGLTKNPKFAQLDKASQFLCLMGTQAIDKKRIENLF